jgi:hypothetical protein
MYIKFNTIAEFNTWHDQVKTDLGISGKDYTKAIAHPTDNTVICGYNRQIDLSGLTTITRESAILSGYISGDVNEAVTQKIRDAVNFFSEIMVQAAGENVLMGITQAGKTKEVADYLADVMRYGQTGSLYEVLAELTALQTAGVPSSLDPFVNYQRLEDFKIKIETYLGL